MLRVALTTEEANDSEIPMRLDHSTQWLARKIADFLIRNTAPCSEVARMISDSMDCPLPLRKKLAIRAHRAICVWCHRYHDQLHVLRDSSRSFHLHLDDISTEVLSADAKKRIKEVVARELK
jgi:hypothetical protein